MEIISILMKDGRHIEHSEIGKPWLSTFRPTLSTRCNKAAWSSNSNPPPPPPNTEVPKDPHRAWLGGQVWKGVAGVG